LSELELDLGVESFNEIDEWSITLALSPDFMMLALLCNSVSSRYSKKFETSCLTFSDLNYSMRVAA